MALTTSDDPVRASPQAMSASCAGISCSDPSIRRGDAHAVIAGVAAADHDDVEAVCG